ncbi:hypothetical protein N566_26460, partial [Streptomycetaceae bacterium MP113-05]
AADTVTPLLALHDRAEAGHARAAVAEDTARRALPRDLADAAPTRLAGLERDASRQAGALEAALRTDRRRSEVRAQLAALDRESRADEDGLREADCWLADWDDTRVALQQRVDDAIEAATRAEYLDGRLGPARQRLAAARLRDRLTDEEHLAGEAALRAREDAADAREHWLDVRNRRLNGFAAELATALRDGEACTVCGATAHPAPRRPAADHVDQRTEDTALAAHQQAENDREAAEGRLHTVRDQLTTARATAGDDTTAALESAAHALESALAAARGTAADAHPAREALDRAEREHTRRRNVAQDAERRAAARTSRREAFQLEETALTVELEQCGTPEEQSGTIAEHAAAVERRARSLAEAADAARTAHDTARALHDADERLAGALRTAGFPHASAVRDAYVDAAGQRRLQEDLDTWQSEEKAVAETLADSALIAAAQQPPADPERAEDAVREADRALRAAATALDAARTRCRELDDLGERATAQARRTAPLRRAHERVSALSHLASGTSGENQRKMRLETYVLAARLEHVAAAASARLARMSAGRYTLVHSDERTSGRARSGLGLHVVDSWTGVQRDTATLSGGETFFASLALALGLADVVTDEAGGTRLDTLFIDEGFGSLDEQTLDEVLDVLDALRERDRSVGIVSHVADLRARIPVQLEVLKTRSGSTLRHRRHG